MADNHQRQSKPLGFFWWLLQKGTFEAGLGLALLIVCIWQLWDGAFNLFYSGLLIAGVMLIARAYKKYTHIEKEQFPNEVGAENIKSCAELKRQLFERTRYSCLTESADPFNSNLRENAQQWSQKRLFDFMFNDLGEAEWFNLWLVYSTILDDEFMICWPLSDNAISKGKDRILLTNKRLVVFTAEKPSHIEREILLSDVAMYKVLENGKLYDVTIQSGSGDHLKILQLRNCPPEERVRALLG
jgi:hypothetical protein